jgi:hypothetical protein
MNANGYKSPAGQVKVKSKTGYRLPGHFQPVVEFAIVGMHPDDRGNACQDGEAHLWDSLGIVRVIAAVADLEREQAVKGEEITGGQQGFGDRLRREALTG